MKDVTTAEELLRSVLKARVYDVADETPLDLAARMSERIGNQVFLKREDLQPVFSFKLRGAFNRMVRMSDAERNKGVICSSAGNHAQGVALAASHLGCRAVIVMPSTTPRIKVEAVDKLGGEVELFGESYDEAQQHALARADAEELVYVHPYDDPDVIAGQGTIGMEILRQLPGEPDVVFVPIGGGGLISGIAGYIKALYPEVKIIGVEPDDAASMKASLEAGHPVQLEHVGLFADGVAVKKVGEVTFGICQRLVDEVCTVSTDAICAAIKDIYEDTRSIMEPAGALALAGCKKYVADTGVRDQTLVAIACGANMNFDRLRHVAERAELGEEREALFAVTIPEQPGSFQRFCSLLGDRSVTEFNYRVCAGSEAHVFVGISTHSPSDRDELLNAFDSAGLRAMDLSNNETAIVHLRHMVGGKSSEGRGERLFRFSFPERPGALLHFLKNLPADCNITLFHYRNHGTDIGRVLAGLQVGSDHADQLDQSLVNLGFEFAEETGNASLRLFL